MNKDWLSTPVRLEMTSLWDWNDGPIWSHLVPFQHLQPLLHLTLNILFYLHLTIYISTFRPFRKVYIYLHLFPVKHLHLTIYNMYIQQHLFPFQHVKHLHLMSVHLSTFIYICQHSSTSLTSVNICGVEADVFRGCTKCFRRGEEVGDMSSDAFRGGQMFSDGCRDVVRCQQMFADVCRCFQMSFYHLETSR